MEEIPPEEKPSRFRKIFLIVLAIFLLAIVLTYFLTNGITRDILAGLIESSTVKNHEVDINSTNKLIFTKESYDGLLEIYDDNPEKEFKVCLKGNISNGDYFINEIFEPEMMFQSHNQVVAEPCPSDSLVSMHSHPIKHCLPSDVDLENFEKFKQNNPAALIAIMCERERFNFYN